MTSNETDAEADDDGGAGAVAPRDLSSFAGRLEYLFVTVRPRGRRPYSYKQVATALADRGVDISDNYIWMLRSGRRDNPTLRHMQGLAEFFGVPTAFLADPQEASRIADHLDRLRELAGDQIEHVAFRGTAIADDTLSAIDGLLDRARQLARGLHTGSPAAHTERDNPDEPGQPPEQKPRAE